jgi:TPR-GreAB-C-PIN type conflict system protein
LRPKSRKKPARNYSVATIKQLFALSSNQCAFPDCTNGIVAAGTAWSKAAVVGHICHIYAASDNGPRGKPGLTNAERNSPGNLILMCGAHHPLVDKQWETHPATDLIAWKTAHERKAVPGTTEAIRREADIEKHAFFEHISDEQIDKSLTRLRQSRYLAGFRTVDEAQALALQVERSRYSSGSAITRARALAWCARILSQKPTIARAGELLRASKALAPTPEAALADAFIGSARDAPAALAVLAANGSPAALTAALRIYTLKHGPSKALAWVNSSRLAIDDVDAEGKFTIVANALQSAEWDTARDALRAVTESDFSDCPALLHVVAMTRLMSVIPGELRPVALTQVPFDADTFPLAATPEALAARREARRLLERVSRFARDAGTAEGSNLASDYALWLGLRDPENRDLAMNELRESMNDPATCLRRVQLALRFGLTLDVAALEERIDRSMALSGKGTTDEAFARFALAFTKPTPQEVAAYIEKHRAQLYDHLQQLSIVRIEIEVLAHAGLLGTARARLTQAAHDGLSVRDRHVLEGIIAEASGSDPISQRRALYESTGELRALVALIDALERAQLWQDLLPYADKLFAATPSADTYWRVVHCLNEQGRYDELLASLTANSGLIDQSDKLRLMWAWTLYREGRFSEASTALDNVTDRNHANARALSVNIAVASGAWHTLLDLCQEAVDHSDHRSAEELLQAAQISAAIGGPLSRDLVLKAIEKDPNNPQILAAAYFHATSAGWEQNPMVASWLNRAAQLSGDDGPLKTMSMQELLDKTPEWNQHATSVVDLLKQGKIPTFAAGKVLNRSLLEFYLQPSLTNPYEVDVRKRAVVFAYSGARPPLTLQQASVLGIDLAAIVTLSRLSLLDTVLQRFRVVVPHSTIGWLFQERQKATFHQPSRIRGATELKQLIANSTLSVVKSPESQDTDLVRQVDATLAAMLSAARDKTAQGTRVLVVRSPPLHRLGTVMSEEANIAGYEHVICSCGAVLDYLKAKAALTWTEEQKARDYLKLHERPWPNEPVIADSTDIYLDDLSVTYLQAAGILGKIKAAGVKAFIAQAKDSEADALLEMETIGRTQLEYIEGIRRTLAAGLSSGRVTVARVTQATEDDQLFRSHPTYGTLGLVGAADALVVDDRFVNQHLTMTNETHSCPLLCSLDVLDLLRAAGDLSAEECFAHRTVLRQSGYQLIPLTDDELLHHMNRATVANGRLVETAELRAIRESNLRARMATIVQLPTEATFLHRSLSAYAKAIKATWESVTERPEAEARADYLLEQANVRNWAASAPAGGARGLAMYAYASYALRMASPPLKVDNRVRAAYYDWITDKLFKPLKEYDPELYQWVVARSRDLVVSSTEKSALEYADEQ